MKVCAAVALLLTASSVWAANNFKESRLHLTTGGKRVRIDVFEPTEAGRHPALLLLHGARGVDAHNRYVQQFAAVLAQAGYSIFLVHYFERTDTEYATEHIIYRDFELWLETLGDALTVIAAQPNVDPQKIGCFGYSLGGYLGVALAAKDQRIRALIEVAGGVDESYVPVIKRLPPTMIVHGDADSRVPVSNAKRLDALLTRMGVEHQFKIFAGEGHYLSPRSLIEAGSTALLFLEKHLK